MINLCAKKNFAIQLSRKVIEFQKMLKKAGSRSQPTLAYFNPWDEFFKVFTLKEVFWGVK